MNVLNLSIISGLIVTIGSLLGCAEEKPVAGQMRGATLSQDATGLEELSKDEVLKIDDEEPTNDVPSMVEEEEEEEEAPVEMVSLCTKANQYSLGKEAVKALALLCDGNEFSNLYKKASAGNYWNRSKSTGDLAHYAAETVTRRRTLEYTIVSSFLVPVGIADFQAKIAPEMLSRSISWRASIVRMKQVPEFIGVKKDKETDVSVGLKFKMDQQSSNRRGRSKYDFEVDMYSPKDAVGKISYERVTLADYGTKRRDTISFIIPQGDNQTLVVTAVHYLQGIQGFDNIVRRVVAEGTKQSLNRLLNVVDDYQNGEL